MTNPVRKKSTTLEIVLNQDISSTPLSKNNHPSNKKIKLFATILTRYIQLNNDVNEMSQFIFKFFF